MQRDEHGKDDIEYRIIGSEPNWLKRGIKEAIEIKKNRPTLNDDEGRFHLSAIWTKPLRRQIRNPLQRTQNNGSHDATSSLAEDDSRTGVEMHPTV